MTGKVRAFLRLLAVQGSWNYERMLGIGLGYAAEPLLEDLKSADPSRHAEAVVRSAEFFNCHPYLAGVALGASVRGEYEAVPGQHISRLRTALCSPLGSLGDQFFWAGLLPALVGITIVVALRYDPALAVIGFLVLYNGARLLTGIWALRMGLASGIRVGAAINQSWLPRAVEWIGPVAGFTVGLAIPVAVAWLLEGAPPGGWLATGAFAGLGLFANWLLGPRVTAVRFGLLAILLALAIDWGRP